jgi:hypothetical protein
MWGYVRKEHPPRNSILIIEEMCAFAYRECVMWGRKSSKNEGEKTKKKKVSENGCVMEL